MISELEKIVTIAQYVDMADVAFVAPQHWHIYRNPGFAHPVFYIYI
jgi:hypothetical protein